MPIYNAALTFIDEMETKRYAGLNKTTFDERLIKKACVEAQLLTIVASQGYHMKTRFSPGYGDWDIKFQPQMLRLAEAKAIDISLTDSYMLMPRKSITAIIGLTSKAEKTIQRLKADCEQCNKVDCLARKESLFI